MLEKDKKCIEFSMRSIMATHKPYQEDTEITIAGMAPGKSLLLANNPFDIPCDVVVVSKRYFERLQADNQQLYKENEELKKKLAVPDPFAEYKELFEKLRSKEDIEKFEWTLNHICGGQASANGWMVTAKLWRRNYETLSKLVGFSSTEEIQEYLTNNVECDTLHKAISKLRDEVTYTCEKLASANSENNSWKATAECNTPKELREKLNMLRDNIEEWKEETRSLKKEVSDYKEQIESLFKVIESWQEVTGCKTPAETKDWVNELGEANGNLAQAILSWQNVTGCSCPKDLSKKIVEWEKVFTPHMSARDLCSAMSNAIESYKHKFAPWEEITGFSTPEKCSSYIDRLEEKLEDIKNLIEED